MLQLIHKSQRSIVGVGVIFFLVLLMGLFGLNPATLQRQSQPAATIDDIELSQLEFYREKERIENVYRQRFGQQFNQLRQYLNLNQQAIETLIANALL